MFFNCFRPQIAEKQMTFAFNRNVPITLRAVMKSHELLPGVPTSISFEIDNQSKKKISRVDISLVGMVQAQARGYYSAGRCVTKSLDAKYLERECGVAFPIAPGETRNAEVTFEVPARGGPTMVMPQGSVQFEMHVSIRYGLKNASIRLPVLHQSATPYYLQDFPANYVFQTMAKTNVQMVCQERDIIAPWWAFCDL